MSKPLVIVESPTKVKTISKILGSDYVVKSSIGHIRDLPRNTKSIPTEYKKEEILWGAVKPNDYKNIYVIPEDRKKIVKELKSLAAKAPEVYLATDDDREGEAIAYHLKEALELKDEPKRIKFNEITEVAVTKAIENPGKIDIGKFKSYEARRTLDRMIGYEISPITRDLGGAFIATGRVQGPALRLVVEREKDRLSFVKSKYFEIEAKCKSSDIEFIARLKSVKGNRIASAKDFDKNGNKTNKDREYVSEQDCIEIVNTLNTGSAKTSKIKEVPRSGKPPKPLKTTSLQSSARNNLGFQPGKTMGVAQKLYQEGLITYMRTDSIRLSNVAIKAAREYISENFSENHLPKEPNIYGDSRKAQAAHEAIRPSGETFTTPEKLLNKYKEDSDEFKLYSLIFNITIASQMTDAKGITKSIEIEVLDENFGPIVLGISGTTWIFGGYRDLIKDLNEKSQELPNLNEGDMINIVESNSEEKFTTPPNRYSSTSLINKLEELGIGRPSTYVSIIEAISSVFVISESSLKPRILAIAMIDNVMNPYFGPYIDYEFSKQMEDELDIVLEDKNPEKAKVNFLTTSHNKIEQHVEGYNGDPIEVTTVSLPFDSRYIIKSGRLQNRTPYPYLLRDDDFRIPLPPEIAIEEITPKYIKDKEKEQEASLKKERSIGGCTDCDDEIYIKLGPTGDFYIQHGIKGVKQGKCIYRNLSGPIFEDEDPENLTIEDAIERFSLSAKNPRHVCTHSSWDYVTAVGPHSGYAMKKRKRQVFHKDDLISLKKKEIIDLVESEKSNKILDILNSENRKIPRSGTKEKIIDSVIEIFELSEKTIKKMSKEELVDLSKELNIAFYRGRYRMKPEVATKENLINKILTESKSKSLESERDALTIDCDKLLSLFGDKAEELE